LSGGCPEIWLSPRFLMPKSARSIWPTLST